MLRLFRRTPAPEVDLDPNRIVFHCTRRGVMAHYASDQLINVSLHHYGEWAEDEVQTVRPYIRPGSTAIDVGANIGTHTLAFAQYVGSAGRVIAFEGQLQMQALLAHNIVANSLSSIVTALPALAGRETSLVLVEMAPSTDNFGAKSFVDDLTRPAESNGQSQLFVPMMTIDSLNLTDVSAIKADVEGMEFDVIKGAEQTIRTSRPAVYFEQLGRFAHNLPLIYDLLSEIGYRLFWHNANLFNSNNFKKTKNNVFGGATEMNILAVHPSVAPLPNLPELHDRISIRQKASKEEAAAGVRLTV